MDNLYKAKTIGIMKRWVEGYLVEDGSHYYIIPKDSNCGCLTDLDQTIFWQLMSQHFEVDRQTISVSVCSRNINNKKTDIYIDNIITGYDKTNNKRFGIVKYNEDKGAAYLQALDNLDNIFLMDIDYILIKGNVVDNPEMLEKNYYKTIF